MATKIIGLVVHNVAWAEAYLRTKWHLDPSSRLPTTDMGQKLGAAVPPFWAGELGPQNSPSNTVWPGLRPTSAVLIGILIHPAVCPQQTWTENWGLCPFLGVSI